MERIDPKTVSPLLNAEHAHRYLWAARGARGHVLDAACGVGYGAPLLMENGAVTRYTGLDRSDEALEYATREFSGERSEFVKGDVYTLPFADGMFDTVVSLETIEHLERPEDALAEFARVLKPDGVLLGSVPQWEFEELCSDAYGPNEFHKSQFTLPTLEGMLTRRFGHFTMWNCWLAIASILSPREENAGHAQAERDWGTRLGSLLFAATRGSKARLPTDAITRILPAAVLAEHERDTVATREKSLRTQQRMIEERDRLVKALETRLETRKLENVAQTRLVDERDAVIRNQAAMIEDRDAALVAQARLIEERTARLSTREQALAQAAGEVQAAQKMARAADERATVLQREVAASAQRVEQAAAGLKQSRDQLSASDAQAVSLRNELGLLTKVRDTVARERDAAARERDAAARERDAVTRERNAFAKERDAVAKERDALAKRVSEHEGLVKAQSDLIVKRTQFIMHLEKLIVERNQAMLDMTRMIQERVELIRQQNLIVADRNTTIEAQTRAIDDRDAAIRSMDAMIAQRDADIAALRTAFEESEASRSELEKSSTDAMERVAALERRVVSLSGSLGMVREELREHLQDMQRPVFLLRQTTRAVFGRTRNGHRNGHHNGKDTLE